MKNTAFAGKVIRYLQLKNNALEIRFKDFDELNILDEGQSCCEKRFITCDDDLKSIIGGEIIHIEYKSITSSAGYDDDVHEIAFVEIMTNKGSITLCTHNEHNGFYGGFDLKINASFQLELP